MRHQDTSAGVIVFQRGSRGCEFLLLLSRLTKRPLWEFPKGGVDAGETLLQAALRELEEETGLSAEDVRLVPGFEETEHYRFTIGHAPNRVLIRKRVTYFLAETTRREIRLSATEAKDYAWLGVDEALRRVRYAERRRMLRAAIERVDCDERGVSATISGEADGPSPDGRGDGGGGSTGERDVRGSAGQSDSEAT